MHAVNILQIFSGVAARCVDFLCAAYPLLPYLRSGLYVTLTNIQYIIIHVRLVVIQMGLVYVDVGIYILYVFYAYEYP